MGPRRVGKRGILSLMARGMARAWRWRGRGGNGGPRSHVCRWDIPMGALPLKEHAVLPITDFCLAPGLGGFFPCAIEDFRNGS